MNKRADNIQSKKKAHLHPHYHNGKKMELLGSKSRTAEKTMAARERKQALLQDVDNLKKKLRHEENVHRALQRAFNRPLGALPRLPPYLPQYTLELLAEVAVLEEEVVRLEEQIVSFKQGLYHSPENPPKNESSKRRHSRSSSQSEVNAGSVPTRPSPSLSRVASIRRIVLSEKENGVGRENDTTIKSRKSKSELIAVKSAKSPKMMQCRIVEQAQESSSCSTDDRVSDVVVDTEVNKLSEDILKCLINIFVRLSSSKGKTLDSEAFSSLASSGNHSESNSRDPYCNFSKFKKRDIGNYKYLYLVEACSVDLRRKTKASFLIQRLKILLDKLSSVRLDDLSHHQKLAFWINIYNSCLMNAYLDHGIPDSPDDVVVQMQKATIKVGGHTLNAVMIEHLILRLPHRLKNACFKSAKSDEQTICRTLGLEWSEPLVTFALSCGSWSSPAVSVYSASQVEAELEAAKRDYLQAAVVISSSNKIIIPKLLDWYLLDFAKNLDGFLDWVCMQLPDELRNEAVKCLERKGKDEPVSQLVQVMPYDFSFRYLIHR